MRYVLANLILVAGLCPPVRFGHAHSNDGEHAHHVGIDLREGHGHDDRHADDLVVEDASFHWHSGLLIPGTTLPTQGGGPVEPGRWDDSPLSIATPPTSPVPACGPAPIVPLHIAWLPPPTSESPATRPAGPCSPPPAHPLVGTVLIRC